ncbi:type IV toxin-antitoxin system AbiEi family antitoxin domain-containing protein [Rhodococcus sp. NBC_00294]|uniref:type IV toxin-antitoxin system AbiEi family antitoxin domain-containing protein n=1 Tax=Rhodococcus sp. NBC_00294 TaxID=2976004 RepID=UPI002E2E25E4|nr:type IV toxin-antitoxin system AbiEi family antitoxin domain-containing protein [Rhodococcus sp. NBC_00294]
MIDRLLAAQDGVVTSAHARAAGLSSDALERRVRSGRWRRVSPGVYVALDRPFTDTARVRCAVWSTTSGVLTGTSAAFWLGLTTHLPPLVEVTVPLTASGRPAPGVRLRRRTLDAADIVEVRRVRVSGLALTVLEASVVLGQEVMDRQLQRHATLLGLRRAQDRNRGRHGSTKAERLLRAAESGARSEAERLVVRLLTVSGLRGWVVNHPFGGYVLDIAFPLQRLAIEIDGWAFHSDTAAFQRDRIRQNVLSASWTVLRYTWRDLTERPGDVIAEIRALVDRVQ